MSRGVLIIIVVVLILAIAGVGLALFWKPGILNTNGNVNASTNTNQAGQGNTNGANKNIQVGLPNFTASIEKTQQLDKTIQYRGASVPLDRVEITNGYSGIQKAEAGTKDVIVYLKNEELKQQPYIDQWFGSEVKLLDSTGATTDYNRAQFLTKAQWDIGQQSYIAFSVDEKASGFKLRFVRPDEDVIVDLGI
ncbi:MAG: hypothetical protein V1778_01305 [bacterium]